MVRESGLNGDASAADARAAIDRAAVHWNHGDVDAARAACEDALRIDPRSVDALAHLGTIRWLVGDAVGAASFYRAAHRIDPRHGGVLVNLATLAQEDDDLDAALGWLALAVAARPGDPEPVWRRGLVELALGDYRRGWADYEAGALRPGLRGASPGFVAPPWDGRPCDRLLLWHEQGYGDTLQFVRYASACRARARRVVVLCPRELVRLLATCPGVDAAVESVGPDDFDAHVPLLSLPHRFGTTLETIPTTVPYLFADPARVANPSPRGGRVDVGLVWAGNARTGETRFRPLDARRNVAMTTLAPLLDVPGVAFHGLQMGPAAVEARGTAVVDAMAGVGDFADTAAIVADLDLVITVDTAVAHLAGALGRPVWILSRRDACWRWLRNRPDSPWYPTARVFGQTTAGDWSDVVVRVRDALADFVARVTPSR